MTAQQFRNGSFSGRDGKRRLKHAKRALRSARDGRLALRVRFQYAYRAAYECALALSDTKHILTGEQNMRDVLQCLLQELKAVPSCRRIVTQWLSHSYLESQLGPWEPDSTSVQWATFCAALLYYHCVRHARVILESERIPS
jgi:hypothetical protein